MWMLTYAILLISKSLYVIGTDGFISNSVNVSVNEELKVAICVTIFCSSVDKFYHSKHKKFLSIFP